MDAASVEPHDNAWRIDEPKYRVYFWDQPPPPAGVPAERVGWRLDSQRLVGARDVLEVLEWARSPERSSQRFVVYAEVTDAKGTGLVKLLGDDPTVSSDPRSRAIIRAEHATE